MSGTDLKGGERSNPVYGEVFKHERAHVIAYWEVRKGKAETELGSFCDEAKYPSSESKAELKQKIKAKLETLARRSTMDCYLTNNDTAAESTVAGRFRLVSGPAGTVG